MERLNNSKKENADISLKIEKIRNLLKIDYTEKEKNDFNKWKENLPENSLDNPIKVKNVNEIFNFLPSSPNWQKEDIKIAFQKEGGFTEKQLKEIFYGFSLNSPEFEIGLSIISEDKIYIIVGDKEGYNSGEGGENYGHYHPISLIEKIKEKNDLPEIFISGLMPSRGDLVSWEKYFKKGQRITRIFSKNGYLEVEAADNFKGFNIDNIASFASKYFDLFLGKNELGIKTEKDMIEYFNDKFLLNIKTYYRQ